MIEGGGLRAFVLTYGATLQDLRLDGHDSPLVLGFEDLAGYETQGAFVGGTIGRYANRIGGASLVIDGKQFGLDASEGDNCLHGGHEGFHRQNWVLDAVGESFVTLSHVSEDGEMGFPGKLSAQCRYRMVGDGTLEVSFRAESDAPTVCSMTQHSYFNLDDGGASPINDHRVRVAADTYLGTDTFDVPTGAVLAVEGSDDDFRQMRAVGSSVLDLNYCLSDNRTVLRPVAMVEGGSGLRLELSTTEAGLQLYTGDYLHNLPFGLDDRQYTDRSGLCLEPQNWPDAPNNSHFPNPVLRPGETLGQTTTYRFSRRQT